MPFIELFEPVLDVFLLILKWWWIWAPPLSVAIFMSVFLSHQQAVYISEMPWTFFEMKIPRELDRSPKAMEHFLTSIHALRNSPGDFLDKYQSGEVTLWFSFEIVSFGGEIHFYIRIPEKHKKPFMANFYANYPTVELEEVDDYMAQYPQNFDTLYHQGSDVWGAELELDLSDVYPIRIYEDFEDIEESLDIDPFAGVLEILTKCDPNEFLAMQILIRPVEETWKDRFEKALSEVKDKNKKIVEGPAGLYESQEIRTPGELQQIKSIENKLDRPAFETTIRYMYITTQESMDGAHKEFARRSFTGALNQHISGSHNKFKRNRFTTTDVKWTYPPYVFNDARLEARKRRIYSNYRLRKMPPETKTALFLSSHIFHKNLAPSLFILSTPELATLYHPPTKAVLTNQLIQPMSSRKLGPPSGLPIYEGNRDNKKQ